MKWSIRFWASIGDGADYKNPHNCTVVLPEGTTFIDANKMFEYAYKHGRTSFPEWARFVGLFSNESTRPARARWRPL